MIGVGGFGDGVGYLMMPLNYDMQVIQQIEMNDMVRISNYSFEMHDNVLRIFPIPGTYDNRGTGTECGYLWFEYIKRNVRRYLINNGFKRIISRNNIRPRKES